ncbi:MAG: hypothetical protein U9Q06_01375 [Nanoarchaeota archaeon]|nr:hypothetical protein [Nanoarchaeota archaeon]
MRLNKKGQLAIFIIIAVVLLSAVVLVFVFRDKIFPDSPTQEFSEVYDYFDDCIEMKTRQGLEIAGVQAGYIDVPEFEAGSSYAPFSSQLDFLGSPVPYWYYVSNNGMIKEQVPSLSRIESQLGDFLESEIATCDFSSFRESGQGIDLKMRNVDVNIRDGRVDVKVSAALVVNKGDSVERKTLHEVRIESDFEELYNFARKFYDKEKKDALLEYYTLDVLYNYAPVTGVEISCEPQIWNPSEIASELRGAISANVAALRVKGDYYELDDEVNKYFVMDVDSENEVNFVYDSNWPTRIEVWPVESNLMVAEPIGLEQGLGILGFCYVPYHFVYDISHPVLIQVYNGEEMFQFPVAVVISKSEVRNSLGSTMMDESDEMDDFCSYKNTDVRVYTYGGDLDAVEADVRFRCLDEKCFIGKTELSGGDAVLSAKFPQCINGIVEASAEGYVSSREIVSTNAPANVEIILDKLYELDLRVVAGGSLVDDGALAIVRFEGVKYNAVVPYPQQKKIKLSEDLYNVSVQVFSGGSLTIPASSSRQCVEVPKSGVAGFFGRTEENCFDVELPAQEISSALSAGGEDVFFVLESELKNSDVLEIDVNLLPAPRSLEQLQQNYELIKSNYIEVELK